MQTCTTTRFVAMAECQHPEHSNLSTHYAHSVPSFFPLHFISRKAYSHTLIRLVSTGAEKRCCYHRALFTPSSSRSRKFQSINFSCSSSALADDDTHAHFRPSAHYFPRWTLPRIQRPRARFVIETCIRNNRENPNP